MTRSQEDLENRLRRVLNEATDKLAVGPETWDGPRPHSRRRRFPLPAVGSAVTVAGVAVAVVVAIVALSLRGPAATPSQLGPTTEDGVTDRSVERAILSQKPPPRLTAASCRAPTPSERANGNATIGGTDSAFFSCEITSDGQSARYYVQILLSKAAGGSFIAELESRHQQQILGCCVARPSR
jgi:hypothetical protein